MTYRVSGFDRLMLLQREVGADYTYRWSLYFPEDYQETKGADIVGQWAAYPTPLNGKFPCGGVGHRLSVKNGGLFHPDSEAAVEQPKAEIGSDEE